MEHEGLFMLLYARKTNGWTVSCGEIL